MGIHVGGSFTINSIIWVTSLPPGEVGDSRRMVEDVRAVVTWDVYDFYPSSATELRHHLMSTLECVEDIGLKPILHLDMHGSTVGLHTADGSVLSWDELAGLLRAINVATGNNLCVIGAACYALNAIKPIHLRDPAPFYALLAPDKLVYVYFLCAKIPIFFSVLSNTGSLDKAHEQALKPEFHYFHCEKLLAASLADYIQKGLVGRPLRERRERLITEVVLAGAESTPENLKVLRKLLKDELKPDQALLNRYAEPFLLGKPCGFNMDDLLRLIERNPVSTPTN